MKQVKVVISADGASTEVSVDGVKGMGCEDLTKSLLSALGQIEDSKKTSEYFQQEETHISCGR